MNIQSPTPLYVSQCCLSMFQCLGVDIAQISFLNWNSFEQSKSSVETTARGAGEGRAQSRGRVGNDKSKEKATETSEIQDRLDRKILMKHFLLFPGKDTSCITIVRMRKFSISFHKKMLCSDTRTLYARIVAVSPGAPSQVGSEYSNPCFEEGKRTCSEIRGLFSSRGIWIFFFNLIRLGLRLAYRHRCIPEQNRFLRSRGPIQQRKPPRPRGSL